MDELPSSSRDTEQSDLSRPAAVLVHPSGSHVFLIGSMAFARQVAGEASSLISAVSPSYIVLDRKEKDYMDQLASEPSSDRDYTEQLDLTWFQAVKEVLGGRLATQTARTFAAGIQGIMGYLPHEEIPVINAAAQQVGAKVLFAERLGRPRMIELGQPPAAHGFQPAEPVQSSSDPAAMPPETVESQDADAMPDPMQDVQDNELAPTESDDLSSTPQTASSGHPSQQQMQMAAQHDAVNLMRRCGCSDPEETYAAMKRTLKAAPTKTEQIDTNDVLLMRQCWPRCIEYFRQAVMQDHDAPFRLARQSELFQHFNPSAQQQLVGNQTAGPSHVSEADILLARRLWNAGQSANGAPVVGVVSATAVAGVRSSWNIAGQPGVEARLNDALQQQQALDAMNASYLPRYALIALTGTAFAFAPRVIRRMGIGIAACSAVGAGFLAQQLVKEQRAALRVVEAGRLADLSGGADAGSAL